MDKRHRTPNDSPVPQPFTQPQDIRIETEKPRSIWPTIAFFCVLFALLAAIAIAYMWASRGDDRSHARNLQRDNSTLKARLVTAEKERTGLEERLKGLNAVLEMGEGTDEDQILAATRQYSATFMADNKNSVVTIDKKESDQAVATVKKNGVSYTVFLVKKHTAWTPVWAGKGGPSDDQRKFYNITIE